MMLNLLLLLYIVGNQFSAYGRDCEATSSTSRCLDYALQKQLTALEQCSVPPRPSFPAKIVSRLTQWRRSTLEDFTACPYTRGFVALGLARASDLYFYGAIERGSATLRFQVIFIIIIIIVIMVLNITPITFSFVYLFYLFFSIFFC